MRINNNLMAMNTHRQLGLGNTAGAKSMEKLSSGYRINRAGDDAAGLAISEKMRGQIRGLTQASRNAQDGISLLQTAEGALNETHAILQRMRELAVQSATDTNTDGDRKEIQKEIDQLSTEITRIAETTQFNTMYLLDGSYNGKLFHIGANTEQNATIGINAMDAKELGVQGIAYTATDVSGVTGLQVTSTTGDALDITYTAAGATNASVPETTATFAGGTITITLKKTAGSPINLSATHDEIKAALEKVADDAGISVSVLSTFVGTATVGTTVPSNTTVSTTVDGEASKAVGIDVSTQNAANNAITTIDSALGTVSSERAKLGAMQNRLDHTIKNLDTSAENLQASESRIRDVDMAKEMMEFTKNSILQQAAQAMLAQANAAPQGVLQLLR